MKKLLFLIFALIALIPMARADKYTPDRDNLSCKGAGDDYHLFPKGKNIYD